MDQLKATNWRGVTPPSNLTSTIAITPSYGCLRDVHGKYLNVEIDSHIDVNVGFKVDIDNQDILL